MAALLLSLVAVSAVLISRDRIGRQDLPAPSPTLAPIARPAAPSDAPLRPVDCTQQVALPEKIDNVRGFALSPDGSTLAVARHLDPRAYSRGLVKPAQLPDPALQHIQFVDLRTLTVFDDIGSGVGPEWSGSGRYLSYHVPQGGGLQVPTELVIFDVSAHGEIARVRTTDITNEVAAWDGDALMYLDGAEVHRWELTRDRVIANIDAAYLPVSGWPVLSPDGYLIANAYGFDGSSPISTLVIEAATGRATMQLADVRAVDWSRTGHRLLVRYDDHRELIDEDGTVHRADTPFVETSVQWSADGRQPLFLEPVQPRLSPYPTSRTLTAFDGRPVGIVLPILAAGSFDWKGTHYIVRWSDGYSPPELRVYTCKPA
jgi:hypothetical protein